MPAFDFVLAGRYRLIAPLGEGGMAAVYRGRDLRLNRDVAIKVLHEDLNRDANFLARFQREAQVVAALSHPHIVPVYDVGEEDGTHFIVMEYVRGRTLKAAIEADGPLPPERAISVLVPVLDALGYAHQHGLIHRDVKPQNILLTPDGTPRLADFGIARQADGSTSRTAVILGSAQYLSPEQSRGEDATPRSDIYACGIVLYEMLTGAPPFDGPNALAIANQHIHTIAAPLQTRVPSLPATLDRIVQGALEKDPAARFADASAFAFELDAARPEVGRTTVQPLVLREPAEKESEAGLVAAAEDATLMLRRSGRKSYVLGVFLLGLISAAAYAAALPVVGQHLPAYPSLPYAVLPGLCALVVLATWLHTRSWIYRMDGHAAIVQWGILSHRRVGIPLRQIVTLELKQSVVDRVLGVGTVELSGKDQHGTERRLVMEDVPRPRQAYEELMRVLGRLARQHVEHRGDNAER